VGADPKERLSDLLTEVARHREAIREYKLSAFPEMAVLRELKLRELCSCIRSHCREHGLATPRSRR
jgi:hypothetical protein